MWQRLLARPELVWKYNASRLGEVALIWDDMLLDMNYSAYQSYNPEVVNTTEGCTRRPGAQHEFAGRSQLPVQETR